MKAGKEHLVMDNDVLLGLYRIDVDKAKQLYGYWEGIEAIVQAYCQLHYEEVTMIVADNHLTRTQNANKLATNQSRTMRHSLSLPPGLMFLLENYDPDLFKVATSRREFMRRFDGFRTCDVI